MTKISCCTGSYLRFAGVLMAVLCWNACSSDQLAEPMMADCETDPPTYNLDIKPIIDVTCAYSGCHFDDPTIKNYESYDGLLDDLEDNDFRQRVIIQRGDEVEGMPPDYATNGPIDLTDEELNIIECWLNAGYPE